MKISHSRITNQSQVYQSQNSLRSFDSKIAQEVGPMAAAIFHHIKFCSNSNVDSGKGEFGMYQSCAAIGKHVGCSERQARYAIQKLLKLNLLKKYNRRIKGPFDNTNFYVPNLQVSETFSKNVSDMTKLSGRHDKIVTSIKYKEDKYIKEQQPPTPNAPKLGQSDPPKNCCCFSVEKKEPDKPPDIQKAHSCLQNLDMPENEKLLLTHLFPAPLVLKAVAKVTSPNFLLKKTLTAAIRHFCQNPERIEETPQDLQRKKQQAEDAIMHMTLSNKCHAIKIKESMINSLREMHYMFRDEFDHVEICSRDGAHTSGKLEFRDPHFCASLSSFVDGIQRMPLKQTGT